MSKTPALPTHFFLMGSLRASGILADLIVGAFPVGTDKHKTILYLAYWYIRGLRSYEHDYHTNRF